MTGALARVAALERRLLELAVHDRELRRQVAYVRQNLRSPDPAGGGGACARTWDLTVTGCAGLPVDGLSLQLRDDFGGGGTLLASGTTDGSGLLTLSTSQPLGAGDVYAFLTGTHPRWATGPYTLSGACGATTAATVPLGPSAGSLGLGCFSDYFCLDAGCARPLKMSQHLVDPYFGVTVPLTYNGCNPGGTRVFTGSVAVAYAACGGCAARASVTVAWTVDYEHGVITAEHRGSIAGCPNDLGAAIFQLTWNMAVTCPTDPDLTLSVSGTGFSANGSQLYCGASPVPVVTEV